MPVSLALLLVALGCDPRAARTPAQTVSPPQQHADPVRVVWQYEVRYRMERGGDLEVEGLFAPGASDSLRIDEDAAPFVRELAFAVGPEWQRAPPSGSQWTAPCRQAGCRVRYRVALGEAAIKIHDLETASSSGDVIVAPPSTWLVHPEEQQGLFRFHVSAPAPARFVAGTHRSPDGAADTYEASTDTLQGASFAAFGPFHPATIERGRVRVEVAIAPHGLALSDADVTAWVGSAVDAIAAYYGRFPVDRTLVIVQAGGAASPTRGETIGESGPAVLIRAGARLNAPALRDDWVMTHELLHVTLPSLSHANIWLSEGIPSYVEPIARARVGLLDPEKLWRELVEGLPQGLPQAGDEGLERTHTWGRTYWGGALFCLLADVTIRERTANAHSLDDALRAFVAEGADVETLWDIEHLLDVADRATGTSVLHDLYRELGFAPGKVDLAALWKRLGIRLEGDHVVFDDGAPLAFVRRAMTALPAAKTGL